MRQDGVIPVIRVQIAEFHVVRTPTKTVTANGCFFNKWP